MGKNISFVKIVAMKWICQVSEVFYRVLIECTDNQGNQHGKDIWAWTISEIADKVAKAGDMWRVNHAHKIIGDYDEVQKVTWNLNELLEQKREVV